LRFLVAAGSGEQKKLGGPRKTKPGRRRGAPRTSCCKRAKGDHSKIQRAWLGTWLIFSPGEGDCLKKHIEAHGAFLDRKRWRAKPGRGGPSAQKRRNSKKIAQSRGCRLSPFTQIVAGKKRSGGEPEKWRRLRPR